MELTQIQPTLKPAPLEGTDNRYKVLRAYLDNHGLDGLPGNPYDMKDYRIWLEAQGYAQTTIINHISVLRELYRHVGIETSRILKSPSVPSGFLKDALGDSEAIRLLDFSDKTCSLRDRLIIHLMLNLGLRECEIKRIDVGDFYQQDQRYWLRIWGKKASGKDQKMEVCNGLLDIMLDYRNQYLKGMPSDHPFILSRKGGRICHGSLSRIVSGIMQAAGVKTDENSHRITPHSLRHTAVTKVLQISGNIRIAQKFARHKDVRTTERYAHDTSEIRPEHYATW